VVKAGMSRSSQQGAPSGGFVQPSGLRPSLASLACVLGLRPWLARPALPKRGRELDMPQTITTGYKALVDAAEREIETLPVEQAIALAGRDDTVLVDIRDPRELTRDGKIPGAFHCPRGMLEFWIDPASPYFKPVFGQDKKFVFFCAGGLRSALAAQTA
jgi:rhodanese-related sulfurtransferase